MKRLKLFALGLLGASVFMTTSCEDDPEDDAVGPLLTVTETSTSSTGGDITVPSGSTLTFEWTARKGDVDLDKFDILLNGTPTSVTSDNGNQMPYEIKSSEDDLYTDGYTVTVSTAGTYTFTVTDNDGLQSSVSFNVTLGGGGTPLGSAQSFTWQRMGGAAGTGLGVFGLEWTQNTSSVAIVKKDQAVKLVDLSGSDQFTDITTEAELMAAVDGGTDMADYRGISVTDPSKTYTDEYIGVEYNGEYYLINVQSSTSTSGGGGGTNVTVNGEFKSTN